MIIKLAFRELIRNRFLNLILILNLSLGLIGFLSIESFKQSIESFISSNSKQILSADFAISARRQFTPDEKNIIEEVTSAKAIKSELYDFFAMGTSKPSEVSKLLLIKAIDSTYPFYGGLELSSGRRLEQDADFRFPTEKPILWAYSEVQYYLKVKKGDHIKLGNILFEVDDFITKDASQTFRLANLAPRVFVSQKWLGQTGLIQFGSTFSQSYLFKLNSPELNPAQTQSLVEILEAKLTDPGVQIDSASSAGQSSLRQLQYLADYLGLSSLIVLLLSSLGGLYLFRLYLAKKLNDMAVQRVLGLTRFEIQKIYLLQSFVLSTLALIPALALSQLFLPVLIKLIQQVTPINLEAELSWSSVAMAYALSTSVHLLMVLPYLYELQKLKPNQLFQEQKLQQGFHLKNPLLYLPLFLSIFGLCVWTSHSFKIGGYFYLTLIAVSILFLGIGWLCLQALRLVQSRGPWQIKFSIKSLYRKKEQSLTLFAVLCLSSFLLNLLPQIKNSLKTNFELSEGVRLPSLFLFDIQDEQVQKIQVDFTELKIPIENLTPMVRARLLQVNGKNFEKVLDDSSYKTREEEREARFRNRGLNLTFRDHLLDSEQIVEGRSFPGPFIADGVAKPFVSIEKSYAERMGFKLGDKLLFDIQGLEIEAEVLNFRRIKWNSFQPNFFISFQPGAIDEAPKTYIANLKSLNEGEKEKVMTYLADHYPNVSSIDVSRTINEALATSEKMSWSLELMSALALVTGMLILYSIIQNQIRSRQWELNLLKILGASAFDLRKSLVFEFLSITLFASLFGIALSFLTSSLLLNLIFDSGSTFDWKAPTLTILLTLIMGLVIVFLSSRKVVQEKPLVLLRESE